ncbi:hypothetical protein BN128_3491 [Cronobacter sakazakii 696]|nr:hypothetical protein BN128_3491 [Cronobacter sakazakii 696]
MRGEIAEANGMSAVAEAKENHAKPNHDHDDNGGDFNHREPELDFAIQPHRCKVRQRDQPHGNQRGYPLRHLREPELDVNPDGGDFRNTHRHPHKPVGPRGEIAEKRAHIAVRVNGERTGYRLKKQHFAHRAHNEKDEQPGDDVGQQHRRPRPFQRAGGAHKQPHPDSAAERNQLDMSGLQPSL